MLGLERLLDRRRGATRAVKLGGACEWKRTERNEDEEDLEGRTKGGECWVLSI